MPRATSHVLMRVYFRQLAGNGGPGSPQGSPAAVISTRWVCPRAILHPFWANKLLCVPPSKSESSIYLLVTCQIILLPDLDMLAPNRSASAPFLSMRSASGGCAVKIRNWFCLLFRRAAAGPGLGETVETLPQAEAETSQTEWRWDEYRTEVAPYFSSLLKSSLKSLLKRPSSVFKLKNLLRCLNKWVQLKLGGLSTKLITFKQICHPSMWTNIWD